MSQQLKIHAPTTEPIPSRYRSKRRAHGFTMMELLLVLSILGVIMALVVPNLLGRQQYANIDATRISIHATVQSLKMYAMDHLGDFPSTAEGLNALMSARTGDRRWRGPYLEKAPTDAWDTPLKYERPGRKNKLQFDVISAGPDKMFDTEDDIGNW